MNKNNFYISLGVWIAILPFTGIPGVWRNALLCASGLLLVVVTLGPDILKSLIKNKPKKRQKSIVGNSNFNNKSVSAQSFEKDKITYVDIPMEDNKVNE